MAQLSFETIDNASLSEPQLFSSFVSLAAGLTFGLPQNDETRALVTKLNSHDLGVLSMVMKPIGRGSSFSVSTMLESSNEEQYDIIAFKQTIPRTRTENESRAKRRIHDIMLELRVLCHDAIRRQENIVKLLGIGWETDPFVLNRRWPVLLLERAHHGSLADYLRHGSTASSQMKIEVSLDVVIGLSALHACGVVHGDLKIENVLLFDNECDEQRDKRPVIAKLADFGGALHDVKAMTFLPTPTKHLAPPEWKRPMDMEHLPKADIYSLGFLTWQTFANGKHPFIDLSQGQEDFDAHAMEIYSEKVKQSDENIIDHLMLRGRSHFEDHVLLVQSILNQTLRIEPVERNLDQTRQILQEASIFARHPFDRNGLGAHQVVLKDQLVQFSFDGIEALDPTVIQYLSQELTRSAKTHLTAALGHQASYGLAVIYINGILQLDDGAENMPVGMSWLQKAALTGNFQAQGLIFRFLEVSGQALPADIASNYLNWLRNAVIEGYFTAEEDLTRLNKLSILEEAKAELCKRRGGTGAQRFPDTHFPQSFPNQSLVDFDVNWTEKFMEKPQSRSLMYSRFGDKLLHFAASCDLRKTTEKLLSESIDDINEGNFQEETPLLLACRAGNYHIAALLLEAGADPSIANHVGDTPLHWLLSFEKGQAADLCRKILAKTHDVDPVAGLWKYTSPGDNAFIEGTPLMRAVSRNCLNHAQILLDAGADPGFTTSGASAIHLAAFLHYPQMLTLLLSRAQSQSPAIEPVTGNSLLIAVFRGGCLEAPGTVFGRIRRHGRLWISNAKEALQIVLENGGNGHLEDLPGCNGINALVLAIHFSQVDIVEAVLQNGGSKLVNTSSVAPNDMSLRCTPLIMSIWMKNVFVFRLLVQYGANLTSLHDIGDGLPLTALYECARVSNGNKEFAKTLVNSGVPVNGGLEDYETPLACALRKRCFSLAEFLFDNGADLNIEFSSGFLLEASVPKTILGYLIQECSISSLAPLEFIFNRCGEKIDFLVNNSKNLSALHLLAGIDPTKQDDHAIRMILDLLLECFEPAQEQLDLTFSTDHLTALHIAARNGNHVVVERLLGEGSDLSIENSEGNRPLDIARSCLQELPNMPDVEDSVVPVWQLLPKLKWKFERVVRLLKEKTPSAKSNVTPAESAEQEDKHGNLNHDPPVS